MLKCWGMAGWLAFQAWLFLMAGRWLVFSALDLWRYKWWLTGLAVMIIAFMVVMLALRLMIPVVQLLLGRTTPRLAQRDFRDGVAQAIFFVKTGGMWKEF